MFVASEKKKEKEFLLHNKISLTWSRLKRFATVDCYFLKKHTQLFWKNDNSEEAKQNKFLGSLNSFNNTIR